MNQVNPFPPLTAPFPLIFLSNLSKINEIALVSNLGKTSLAKGTATFISKSKQLFCLNYSSYYLMFYQ